MNQEKDDLDPMLGRRQSSVMQTLRAARESVREIYRPVTPNTSRSLFSIDQYHDRPKSSHNRSVFSREGSQHVSRSKPARLRPIRRKLSPKSIQERENESNIQREKLLIGGKTQGRPKDQHPREGSRSSLGEESSFSSQDSGLHPTRPKTASTRARTARRPVSGRTRPKSARSYQTSGASLEGKRSAAPEFEVIGRYTDVGSAAQAKTNETNEDEKFVTWRERVESTLAVLGDLRASQIDNLLQECDKLHSLVDQGMNQLEWTVWLKSDSTVFSDDKGSNVAIMEAILRSTMHVMNRETVLEPEVTLFLKTACINLKLCMGNETSFALRPSLQSLFYLSKRPQNDSAFRRERVIPPLINYLRSITRMKNGEGIRYPLEVLVFVAGILKNICNDEGNQKAFIRSGAMQIFFDALETACNVHLLNQGMSVESKDKWAQLCVQLTSLIRTMLPTGTVLKLFSDDLMHACLAKLLVLYIHHHELTFNITRIFSKLTVDEPWSEFVGENDLTLQALMEVIKLYQLHYDVMIRALFALGSITMYNQRAQEILCSRFEAQKILISIVTVYSKKLQATASPSREKVRLVQELGRNEKEIDSMETMRETSEPLTKDVIADVLSKVLCIVANLSMLPENGRIFAESEELADSLQYLISCSTVQNDEELILNVISVVANISYYQGEEGENHVLKMRERILLHAVPYLFSENIEIAIQATRIFSNYSRIPECREFMHREYIIEKLAYLLSHVHLGVACAAVGPLINLFSSATKETAIIGQQIESKIIDVLERLTSENDSEASRYISPACKALFNARHAQKTWEIPYSDDNTVRFVELSETLNDLKGRGIGGDSWSVAQNLIQSFTENTT
ncbi:armadillo repeat domain-containing protein [Chloropicon primus]|uniref:Armadillo repeat domain-containing protein n=1 Tax=Chloropicon primus TaxID=1764295 RepID=A0A5B8MCQ5_9CHLO|nr:armadillo repeat domain-containing protein [Chloropicon primus]UPQ97401.1 armadillo repeat domain-containing protein [Chloropicon primus]|eukprot:QDZ18189.1 armadillo repeat domain-containing protein [Chloropicon primus]